MAGGVPDSKPEDEMVNQEGAPCIDQPMPVGPVAENWYENF
jgi:hypothetical protein